LGERRGCCGANGAAASSAGAASGDGGGERRRRRAAAAAGLERGSCCRPGSSWTPRPAPCQRRHPREGAVASHTARAKPPIDRQTRLVATGAGAGDGARGRTSGRTHRREPQLKVVPRLDRHLHVLRAHEGRDPGLLFWWLLGRAGRGGSEERLALSAQKVGWPTAARLQRNAPAPRRRRPRGPRCWPCAAAAFVSVCSLCVFAGGTVVAHVLCFDRAERRGEGLVLGSRGGGRSGGSTWALLRSLAALAGPSRPGLCPSRWGLEAFRRRTTQRAPRCSP
jgi:hypothetical protein